jgi:hypothetical protein
MHGTLMRFPLTVYSDPEFIHLTGVCKETFQYLYTTYCGENTVINKTYKLYQLLYFYRHYPTARSFLVAYGCSARAYSRYLHKIYKYEQHLSSVINEIRHAWTNRLDGHNHLPHVFGPDVTGSIDTFPVYVVRPVDTHWQRCLYNGKYGGHVAKVQVVSDHRGSVIWWSGPHCGTIHDLTLFRQNPPPLLPNEQLLADKAYVGGGAHLIAPYKKRNHRLAPLKTAFNKVHRWYRSTVEHSIGFIKRFYILSGMFRGHLTQSQVHLQRALTIIIHLCSYDNQQKPHRSHFPLYDSVDDDDDNDGDSEAVSSDVSTTDVEDSAVEAEDEFDESSFDPLVGTGRVVQDFRVYQQVLVYWIGEWWDGTVTKVMNGRGRVNVRLVGQDHDVVDLLPKHIRHVT